MEEYLQVVAGRKKPRRAERGGLKVVSDIRNARHEGRLQKRFGARDLQNACPGWAEKTYHVFLPKHRRNNPGGYTAYFEWHSDGSYSLIDEFKN